MRIFLSAFVLFFSIQVFSQQVKQPNFDALDSLYREDQFYFSFTYNILTGVPKGLSQNKFSVGLSGGFLRDFPVNKKRNMAIAIGLGYSLQNYNYNLVVDDTGGKVHYDYITEDVYYEKNKLSLNYLDIPIEFRWRTSTPDSHKFWRVYTGFKFSYLFNSRAKFVGDGTKLLVINNDDLNKMRYGVYTAAGYNTWNFYAYYGLNPIFRQGTVENNRINMSTLSLGLMFYIL
jgi:hypothetical protein